MSMMAEHSFQGSVSQSSIPLVTPRPSRSSVSSTFPLSQSSLVSQFRRTSESATQPSVVATSIASPSPQTPVSSVPSFRSLRNLLPFAPAKSSNPPPTPPHPPKPSFVSFGSLRRIAHDRKNSTAHTSPPDPEQPPVITIARPSQTFEEEMMARKRSRDINRSTLDTSLADERATEEHYVLPLPSPGPPLGADLSTIIEAENSGISKHIPCLEDTTQGDGDDATPVSPFNFERGDTSRLPSPDSRAASVFDLSTSRLTAEVMHALKHEDSATASEWLQGVNGIVVEGGTDDPDSHLRTPVNGAGGGEDLDAALDFDALDPDLAELLSPNKINGKSQSPNHTAGRLPSRAHSGSPSRLVAPPSFNPVNGNGVLPRASPRLGTAVPLASRALVQTSPTRRSTSLSRANPARGSTSSLPRLTRSVTTAPPPSVSDSSDGTSTHAGMRGSLHKKRHQPPSPLSSQTHSSQVPSPTSSRESTDIPPRRLAGSRLATPNRHGSSSYAPGSACLVETPAVPPSTIQKASSAQFLPRSASDPTRQPNARPNLETSGALEMNRRRRPHLFSNRRRSMSVEDARLSPTSGSTSPVRPSSSLSNRPPATEWLGPRTVKAFAAAGLLDGDRDGSHTHAPGHNRYASLRAHSERDERFVPSRMAFSEAASTSSWGRSGSFSRGVTPSEGGVTYGSPTFSAPRTTFSGSTAPTSISATSSSQQAALQMMKEKHDLETEALLAALSDSQRTTKTLREENDQLRNRVRELEDRLDDMRAQIHRLAVGVAPRVSPSGTFSCRTLQDQSVLLPSPLAAPRRPAIPRTLSHTHTNGLSVSALDPSPVSSRAASPIRDDSPAPVTLTAPRPRRRRASTSSSVFPNPPPNMSMLMLEDAIQDRPASMPPSPSPPSPTRAIPQRAHMLSGHAAHVYASALSPAAATANVSPTIASFSLTEIPGSPSSLQLRPEHELHLGDMTSLSLYAMSDDEL